MIKVKKIHDSSQLPEWLLIIEKYYLVITSPALKTIRHN